MLENSSVNNDGACNEALPPQVDQLKFLFPDGADSLRCEALASGDHNHVWRVRSGQRDVVVRLPKTTPHSKGFYRAEFFNQFCAYHLDLAPRIWAEDVRSGLLVSAYLSGRTVKRSDFDEPAFCRALVAALHRLHNSTQWFLYQHDYLASVAKKIRPILDAEFIPLPATLYKMSLLAERCRQFLVKQPLVQCPIHADLALKNMIKTDQGLRFIDWEVSGMGDCLEDLAFVIFNSDMAPTAALNFMQLYFESYPESERELATAKTILYWILHIYSWTVEHERRAEAAEDPTYDLKCRNDRIQEFRVLMMSAEIVKPLKQLGLLRKN